MSLGSFMEHLCIQSITPRNYIESNSLPVIRLFLQENYKVKWTTYGKKEEKRSKIFVKFVFNFFIYNLTHHKHVLGRYYCSQFINKWTETQRGWKTFEKYLKSGPGKVLYRIIVGKYYFQLWGSEFYKAEKEFEPAMLGRIWALIEMQHELWSWYRKNITSPVWLLLSN